MVVSPIRWQGVAQCGQARAGWLHTPHGSIPTPTFMAVATCGGLKGVTATQAQHLGQGILLGNTYHLALRPGPERVHELGGLHTFAGFPGPWLTDSGGYQVFSLAANRTIDENGVSFRSHLDGRALRLTPESSIAIQRQLGADIIMAFDECPPAKAPEPIIAAAVLRTCRWLERSVAAWRCESGPGGANHQGLYAIIQGGTLAEQRRISLEHALSQDLPGYAVGGLAVGESAEDRHLVLDTVLPLLPTDRPRYLMGVGTPLDLIEAIARGIDQFDCVLPTRMGRHGIAYTDAGPLRLKRCEYATDRQPIDKHTPSEAASVPRGYLNHLLKAGEPLGGQLLSLHNLSYYRQLMARARAHIRAGTFAAFRQAYVSGYQTQTSESGDA